MTIARFPDQCCCVCGEEFIPGETQIEKHPSIVGPRGGAKWCCIECCGGSGARANPYAGPSRADLFHVTTAELKAMRGNDAAAAELERRKRNRADKKAEGKAAFSATTKAFFQSEAGKQLLPELKKRAKFR